MQHSLFYDWLRYLLQFESGGGVNMREEEDEFVSDLVTTVFVEQPMASPGLLYTELSCLTYLQINIKSD